MVTDSGEPLLIGGTYGDVLATVVGERSGTLRWRESEQFVRGFPQPGETEIAVEIHEPSMAWDIEIEKRARRNERLFCNHALETELEIELQTGDGSLDISVVVPVALDSVESATIVVDITEQELGDLRFDPVDADASLRLMLSYRAQTEPEGALLLSTNASDDDGSGVGMTVDLATWTLE
ncbi:MAG: hypothetical protein AAGF11_39925 [Myxococcota bacterium]